MNCCRRLPTRSLEVTPLVIRGVSLLHMDFSKEFPFEFAIRSYGYTKLNVMYTNDLDSVKLCLAESKQYLQDEKAHVKVQLSLAGFGNS